MSLYPYSAEREKQYARVSRFGDKYNTSIQDGHRLWVPRETAPLGKIDGRVVRPVSQLIASMPPLDQDQTDVVSKSSALLLGGKNHIFEAPTGFGKTYCASAIALNLCQATLIVVPKTDLMKEWEKTLIRLIGIDAKEIGVVRQNKCKFEGKRFVIGMVNSLVEHDYPKEMYEYFGMVIFDETHRMGAETFSKATRLFPGKYRLGVSATPERSDGKDPMFKENIGRTMVKGHTVPMKPKILVRYTKWQIKPTWTKDDDGEWKFKKVIPSGTRMMGVYNQMAIDPERNQIIVDFVMKAYQHKRRIVVVGDLLDNHLRPMMHLLGQAGIPAERMGFYIGGQTETELDRVKETCNPVLATHKMVQEGTNVPWWDCMVAMTPHAQIEQTLGRIMRRYEGKPTPVFLDLVDQDSIFHGYFASRQRQYQKASVGATVVWVK